MKEYMPVKGQIPCIQRRVGLLPYWTYGKVTVKLSNESIEYMHRIFNIFHNQFAAGLSGTFLFFPYKIV